MFFLRFGTHLEGGGGYMFFDPQTLNFIFVMFVWCAVVFLWVYGFVQEDRENDVFFKFNYKDKYP